MRIFFLLLALGFALASDDPVFDTTAESGHAARAAAAAAAAASPSTPKSTPTGYRTYATLYAFAPDLCQMREHRPVYDFINAEATHYHDLEVVYVSMDGNPPVIRFFADPSRQAASTIDSDKLTIEQLQRILKEQSDRLARGEKEAPPESVNIKQFSVQQIKDLLSDRNVIRGAPRSKWAPPSSEPPMGPGFEVPADFVPSGEPDVPLEEMDDSIVKGTQAKKAALKQQQQQQQPPAAPAPPAAAAPTS